jgi:hypothetical protein
MANQLIIKGPVKISSEVNAVNVQNVYSLPSAIGGEGQVLKVVAGQIVWATPPEDNDGVIGPLTYMFDTVSPIALFTVPAGTLISDVIIEIVVPFSDPSATLSVGDSVNSSIIMVASDIDLSAAPGQIFRGSPGYVYPSDTPVILTLDPQTSSSGSFKITLSYMQ